MTTTINASTTAGLVNTADTSGVLALQTAGTTAVTVDASQNVGIGTGSNTILSTLQLQTPAQTSGEWEGKGLLIKDDTIANSGLALYSRDSEEHYIASLFDSANSYLILGARKSSSGNQVNVMTLRGSGNVGVGTDSPSSRLEVYVQRTSSTNATAIVLNDNVTGGQTNGVYKSIQSRSNNGASVSEIRFLESDGTNNNTAIAFATAGVAGGITERVRILNTGAIVCLAGGNTAATGTGIAFPSSQSASSDANTLDDYEEGTWTPTIQNFTVSGTSTLSGTYTKIGRVVYFNITFANTGTIAFSASALITLPFTGIDQSGMIAMYVSTAGTSQTSGKSGVQMAIDAVNGRMFTGDFTTTSAGEQLFFGGFYRVS